MTDESTKSESNPWAVSIRLKHYNTAKSSFQIAHDFRDGKQPKYVDETRSHLNTTERGMTAKQYREEMLERRKLTNPKRPPLMDRAAIMTGGIITFGHLAQVEVEKMPPILQDAMYREIATKIAAVLGNDLEGWAAHRDEEAPHAHFQMPSRRASDGRLMSEVLTPSITSQLQDEAAKIAQNYSSRIQRGEKKEKTGAVNKSVQNLHRTSAQNLAQREKKYDDLKAEVTDLETTIDSLNGLFNAANLRRLKNEDLAEASRQKAVENEKTAKKHLKNAETYEKRAKNAQSDIKRITERLETLNGSIKHLEGRKDAIEAEIAAAQTQLAEVQKSTVEAQKSLVEAQEAAKGIIGAAKSEAAQIKQNAAHNAQTILKDEKTKLATEKAEQKKTAKWVENGMLQLQAAIGHIQAGTYQHEVSLSDMSDPQKFAILKAAAPDNRPTFGFRAGFWALNFSDGLGPIPLPEKIRTSLTNAFDRVALWAAAVRQARITAREAAKGIIDAAKAQAAQITQDAAQRASDRLNEVEAYAAPLTASERAKALSNARERPLIGETLRQMVPDLAQGIIDTINSRWKVDPRNPLREVDTKPKPSPEPSQYDNGLSR